MIENIAYMLLFLTLGCTITLATLACIIYDSLDKE